MSTGGDLAADSRFRRVALITTCCVGIGELMGLAAGAIAIAPGVADDLAASQTDVQWVSDSFPVVVAALLLPAGSLLDRFGRRRGMQLGIAVLVGALLWTALAGSIEGVIASRALAGIGAALLFPGTLASITATLPEERRSSAIGLWAVSVVVGGMVGLFLFAASADVGSWRTPFVVNAGICVAVFIAVWTFVPETRAEHEVGLDPVGGIFAVIAVGALAIGVSNAPVSGWFSVESLAAGILCVAGAVAFVVWERRERLPLLDVGLFRSRLFAVGSATLFLTFFAHFALFFLAFQYQIYVLDRTVLQSAIGVVPPAVGCLLSPLGTIAAARIGRRPVLVFSLLLSAVGAVVAAVMASTTHPTYWTFAVGGFLIWSGVGLAMAPPTEMIIEAVPPEKHGVASAMNDLARELSAAVGIAVAGSTFNSAYRSWVSDRLPADIPTALRERIVDSPAAAGDMSGDPGLVRTVHDGVMSGWTWGFGVVAATLVVGAVAVRWACPAPG